MLKSLVVRLVYLMDNLLLASLSSFSLGLPHLHLLNLIDSFLLGQVELVDAKRTAVSVFQLGPDVLFLVDESVQFALQLKVSIFYLHGVAAESIDLLH